MIRWAIKWRSENAREGKHEHFIADAKLGNYVVFRSREAARAYIKRKWGYIAKRKDLRSEPHGWKMPIAVRVKVQLQEITTKGLETK